MAKSMKHKEVIIHIIYDTKYIIVQIQKAKIGVNNMSNWEYIIIIEVCYLMDFCSIIPYELNNGHIRVWDKIVTNNIKRH